MIFTNLRVRASGLRTARLAVIGMSPAKQELADGIPFVGPSGKLLNDALLASRSHRSQVYVTNLCEFFIDDNDLYSVPEEVLESERMRVFDELGAVGPNCLLILGSQTLVLLMEGYVGPAHSSTARRAQARWSITKWRGSIINLTLPSGRQQKCVAAMHPASFIRGQWKWLPLFKYIDVPRAVTQSSFSEMKLTPRETIVGPSFRIATDFLREANEQPEVSIDYEGMSHITCLGAGWSASQAICVPLSRVGSPTYWSLEEEAAIWKLWCALLQNPNVRKIAQNAAYEWIKSWMHGIYPTPLGIDTMHTHHCLYPDWGGVVDEWTKRKRSIDNPGHGLALIASQYTDQPFYKDEGRHWRPEHGELRFWQYNGTDVMVTFEAAMKMRDELRNCNMWDIYEQNYLEQFPHTLRMEWFGVQMDVARREAARETMQAEMAELRQSLKTLVQMDIITKAKKGQKPLPGVLNLASPLQMKAFFAKRGYAISMNKKTGKPKLDKDDLARLAIRHNDESIRMMLKMRKIQDLINDVIDAKLDAIGRIHCHFKIGGTNGTRWSSTESILGTGTNLQNLPRQGIARSLFIPN